MRNWSVLLARGGTGFGLHEACACAFYWTSSTFCFAEGRFLKGWTSSAVYYFHKHFLFAFLLNSELWETVIVPDYPHAHGAQEVLRESLLCE